ncbi:hypothetical protein A0H81_03172 [Grifola frondosa]|uniref:Uncharacterized protein n=1 Tax=Grifola frondosa TaxID=5627 RepID=A0A1C7MJL3_GRIFR|nr:hypothetical protein A0H81_03172 [Grifola frondosa]
MIMVIYQTYLCGKYSVDGVERPTVLYSPSVKTVKTKVAIRVQGFVESANLGPLGNWDGREQNASTASQHITLHSGGIAAPFRAQLEALEELRYGILSFMCHETDSAVRLSSMETIQLSRRVFHKIPLVPRKEIRNALRAGDDPRGKAAKIAERWRVPVRIGLGLQREDGKIVHTSHIGVRKGDFVDVSFTPEIITKRSRQGTHVELKFDIQDVMRLYTRNEFSDEVLALLSPDCSDEPNVVVDCAESGFAFENDAMLTT